MPMHSFKSLLCFGGIVLSGISACSNQALYNEGARLQCEERYQYKPPGEAQVQCMNEKEIDGMTYDEYERERNATENSSGQY